ncbi:PilZ domain-containing protein [Catenovulum sediminis]|uniref:PilZ domain-containing protein n=1 Tax=Catenovulum sediminis TaxID=1740262 RepID=UPI00117D0C15|nr:PilZ domain-containing protein [Catenovulum sediminis]
MTLEEKKQLFTEFFTLPLALNINLEAFADNEAIPDDEAFLEEIPYPFKLATQINSLDAMNIKQSHSYGNHTAELVDLLNIQAKKIDLIMSHLLLQEDHAESRYKTQTFGAGGLTLINEKKWLLEQSFRLKIFMPEEASAVYCFAEIIDIQQRENLYEYQFVYTQIRDEDREILVRAALHQQSKHLRQLAQQRANSAKDNK